MVKIRLMRVGKKKQPSYRVVVADSRSPRDGRIIEAIGHYNPRSEPSIVEIDSDRAVHWLEKGAQPSDSVRNLLVISGAWGTFTGEAPPPSATPTGPKATRAGAVKSTPAASVDEVEDPAEAAPSAVPEATGQTGAAADARADEDG